MPSPSSRPLLIYSGWLNEAHSYDPANYRPAQTRSVHLRLEGTTLRVSSVAAAAANSNSNASASASTAASASAADATAACAAGGNLLRISRRATWNEAPLLHLQAVATYTRHRAYEVRGAQVALLPRGLARKRHFSRKYPIEVVMRRGDEEWPTVVEVVPATAAAVSSTAKEKQQHQQHSGETLEDGATALHRNGDSDRNFGETIMFSNVSHHHRFFYNIALLKLPH